MRKLSPRPRQGFTARTGSDGHWHTAARGGNRAVVARSGRRDSTGQPVRQSGHQGRYGSHRTPPQRRYAYFADNGFRRTSALLRKIEPARVIADQEIAYAFVKQ